VIFNTPWFLAFFVLVYAALWAVPGPKARFWFVLAASAVFHTHFAGPAGVAPIVVMAVIVFLLAPQLHAAEGSSRKAWLAAGLAVPVAGLVYYKYRAFLLAPVLQAWPASKAWLGPLASTGPMPLAISFFTFEFVHYLTEVYKGNDPIRRPARFALFCIYFPSIVSGPIKRYQDFEVQLDHGIPHPGAAPQAAEGAAQLLLGFFKKLVIADNVTTFIALMDAHGNWGPRQAWLLLLLLCVRILFDFSGYSDMALGLSKLLGLRLPANFHFPYLALNPSDFWRRWHMSLSSWIRDYIYIPLGGSRQGLLRRSLNGLAAMALCGLWHGAALNFVVWGLYHGLGLGVWGAWAGRFPAPERRSWLSGGLAWVACMVFVAYGWLWFFYPVAKAWRLTRVLVGMA
jgi:alginate O-acetyltransferase complex protein AlgI